MDFRDYEQIITIAEEKSFSKASKKLFIAQSSLSNCVKRVEDTYGVVIFSRSSKGVNLTKDGEMFVEYARKLLSIDGEFRRQVSRTQNREVMELKLGISPVYKPDLYNIVIAGLSEKYPNMKFDIKYEGPGYQLEERLLDGQIDIAFYNIPVQSTELKHVVLYNDRICIVPRAGSKLADNWVCEPGDPIPKLEMSDLNQEILAMPNRTSRFFSFCEYTYSYFDFEKQVRFWSTNYAILNSLAKRGLATALLLESFFGSHPEKTPYYLLNVNRPYFPLAVVWKDDASFGGIIKDVISLTRSDPIPGKE